MKNNLVLTCSFLYYRRQDHYWPLHTFKNGFLVGILLYCSLALHNVLYLLAALLVFLLLELPRWYDKPRCLISEDSITVKRQRYTYRMFRMADLNAVGSYREPGREPMFFLCTVSEKQLKQFWEKHQREQNLLIKHYGYDADDLSQEALRRLMLTLYLWKKAKLSNPNTAVICLSKQSWVKLNFYRANHQLPYIDLSAPAGGCYDEY